MNKGNTFGYGSACVVSVPENGAKRSRRTSFSNHQERCVLATRPGTETKRVFDDVTGEFVEKSVIVNTIIDGCCVGKLCAKGVKLLAEIDNPPEQGAGNPPGSKLAKRLMRRIKHNEGQINRLSALG